MTRSRGAGSGRWGECGRLGRRSDPALARLAEEVQRRLGTGDPLPPAARERYARRLGFDVGVAAVHRGAFAAAAGRRPRRGRRHRRGPRRRRRGGARPPDGRRRRPPGSRADPRRPGVAPAASRRPALPFARPSSPDAPGPAGHAPALAAPADPARRGGPAVQRALGDGHEAAARAAEASILQTSRPGGRPRRAAPDPERLAELVYQRFVDAVREDASRLGRRYLAAHRTRQTSATPSAQRAHETSHDHGRQHHRRPERSRRRATTSASTSASSRTSPTSPNAAAWRCR